MHQHRSALCVIAQYLRTPISAGCFFGTPQIFCNLAAHLRAVTAGDCKHNIGNAFFSSNCVVSFSHIAIFISERTRAQLWHYFIASLFHTTLALPNLRALRVRTICTNRPFRLATLVCSSARCGYLTPYLSVPKRTDNF